MEGRAYRNLALAALACVLSAAPALLLGNAQDQFSEWSEPVNMGLVVNTVAAEFGATVSRDGLCLYFHSNRPGGFGGFDIWVSQRVSVDDPWEWPVNLGPMINTQDDERLPALSLDGHRLYFDSSRPGGFGARDLYVSRRHNKRDDFAWKPPENLGGGVNSPADEGSPAPFEDDATGTITLYFSSTRPGGLGGSDIYASDLQFDETFGPAVLVEELSSPSNDIEPAIRRDGLEMYLTSNRPGSIPFPPPFQGRSFDLWVSTRATTADRWSAPVNLGPALNGPFNDGWAALSFDGTILYFSPARPDSLGTGTLDLYTSTRSRLRDPD